MAKDEGLPRYVVSEEDKPRAHDILAKRQWDEMRQAGYADDINPADMTVPPQSKPQLESETKEVGALENDPRAGAISPLAVDTVEYGTETPWRDTPPHNYSSQYETDNDHSPPGEPPNDPADTNASEGFNEPETPPEGETTSRKRKRG
jgi:hypothetical protein